MSGKLANILIQKELDSFSEFAELAVSWDADFRQLNRERFSTSMLQAQTGDLLFSHARMGCHVEQRGQTPPGMRTFALTEANSNEMHWFKRRVGTNCLLLFPKHNEISVFSQPGFSAHTVSMPEQLFEAQLESYGLKPANYTHDSIFQLSVGFAREVRKLLVAVPEVVKTAAHSPALLAEFREQLLASLFSVMEQNSTSVTPVGSRNQRVFRAAMEFVHEHSEAPLKVGDLVAVTGASERSLQYLFKREIGLTPKAYLTGKRLGGVRRDLLHSRNRRTRVSEIANKWGFWHMSQFACDYRKMFDELPSESLKRIA